jgi:PTS system N-acetylglucosamine-specific IIC component
MVLMHVFQVRLGFSFSAGLFDYILNYSHAQRPLLLLPIGAVYFALYYGVFRLCIVRFNLATPGRETEEPRTVPVIAGTRAQQFVSALGGAANLAEVNACTTRLRLVLVDTQRIDEAQLKQLGARGLLRTPPQGLQVVLGPIADQVAGEIRDAIRAGGQQPKTVASNTEGPRESRAAPLIGMGAAAADLLAALGGATNVSSPIASAGRLLIEISSRDRLDADALGKLGVRGMAATGANRLQIILPKAEGLANELKALLSA